MMKFATLLRKPPEWMLLDGPHRDIVITSRVRLARNSTRRSSSVRAWVATRGSATRA